MKEGIPLLRRTRLLPPEGTAIRTLDEYRALDGYRALRRAPAPAQLLDEIERSGLRGRGGGGFPAARKWRSVAAGAGAARVVICNVAEGEPGTFKDRWLARNSPHLLVEGTLLAARAVGAREAHLFACRAETAVVDALSRAVAEASEAGLLAPGEAEAVSLTVATGPDGYVVGEETALLETMEGRRPWPRQKPPDFPSARGLLGRPTLVSNAETLAHVPLIADRGADAFRAQGVPSSPGTMVFSVSGDVAAAGVAELPLGTPLREILELGGARRVKAVLPGGFSNPLLPAGALATPADFDSLRAAGSGLGAGGLIALSEDRCLVREALAVARFHEAECCGQCPPCTYATSEAVLRLSAVESGNGAAADLAGLQEALVLARTRGICGFLPGFAETLLSFLDRFPAEFRAHLGRPCSAEGSVLESLRPPLSPP